MLLGQTCDEYIDNCASSPCMNNGTCVDTLGNYTCQCVPGYTGQRCEEDIDECASDPCANEGICSDHVASFSCTCVTGYLGRFLVRFALIASPGR